MLLIRRAKRPRELHRGESQYCRGLGLPILGVPYYKCTGLQNPFLSMKAPSPIRHLQEVERTEVNRSKVPSPTAGA